MNEPTQALTKRETADLIELVKANNLPLSQLACEFSRQQGQGTHITKGARPGRVYSVSFDLQLCAYCGNLMPQKPACPAKLQALAKRLLPPVNETVASEP